jgi:hypothetical protein
MSLGISVFCRENLSPWSKTLKTPSLKFEKENFGANGGRKQLFEYCISAKLYYQFNLEGDRLLVRKPSGHGLGFLQAPYTIALWPSRRNRQWEGSDRVLHEDGAGCYQSLARIVMEPGVHIVRLEGATATCRPCRIAA